MNACLGPRKAFRKMAKKLAEGVFQYVTEEFRTGPDRVNVKSEETNADTSTL